MYRTVEFRAVYTDEGQLDGCGNNAVPGARDLAEAFVARLRSHAQSVTDIEEHSDYGWGFDVRFQNRSFHNVLNPIDDQCFLTVSLSLQWLWALLLRHPRETFDRYCQAISETFSELPQVSAVKWEDYRG